MGLLHFSGIDSWGVCSDAKLNMIMSNAILSSDVVCVGSQVIIVLQKK